MNYERKFYATFEIIYCPIEQTVFYLRRILICVYSLETSDNYDKE